MKVRRLATALLGTGALVLGYAATAVGPGAGPGLYCPPLPGPCCWPPGWTRPDTRAKTTACTWHHCGEVA